MHAEVEFILRHGYAFLFALNLGEQLGRPLPAGTALLAAGGLAKAGRLSLPTALSLSVLASLLGHTTWYVAGRLSGIAVLRIVCRVSLEPDSCVRRTNDLFLRH